MPANPYQPPPEEKAPAHSNNRPTNDGLWFLLGGGICAIVALIMLFFIYEMILVYPGLPDYQRIKIQSMFRLSSAGPSTLSAVVMLAGGIALIGWGVVSLLRERQARRGNHEVH